MQPIWDIGDIGAPVCGGSPDIWILSREASTGK